MSNDRKDPVEEMQRVVRKELTDSEASCLFLTFSSHALLIAERLATDRVIASLYKKIQLMVKTVTKSKLVSAYSFDGLVPMSSGQGNTVLQYVLKGSDLNCAKIGDVATISNEVRIARLVHENQQCPSVMHVIDTVNIGDSRMAMIAPLYPLPLSHMDVLPENTVINMAICALATIKAFSNKNLCHGDIKPSNMMFQAGSRTIVTIDFGSTVQYGEPLLAISPLFALDCPTKGSLHYDLTCLATSILFLLGNSLEEFNSRAQAREWLTTRQGTHYRIASLCLDPAVESADSIWETCKQVVNIMYAESDWVVDCDAVWPTTVGGG
jgi:serine/threonine protein kinase